MAFAERLRQGEWRVEADPEWSAFVPADWQHTLMDLRLSDRYHAKQGRSIVRWTLTHGPRPLAVYLKRHLSAPRLLRWLSLYGLAWGRSAAVQEYRNLRWAEKAGVPVPRPWASGERAGPGASFSSFLAVEELAGMLPLHEAIPLAHASLAPVEFTRWKRGLTAELARLSRMLHDRGRFHKDLYLCHFYLPAKLCRTVPTIFTGQVWMIDFHRLGHHPLTAAWWRLKDLAQLLYSSDVPGVTARDRIRFWKLYGRGGRITRWLIELRGRNYREHNATRKLIGPQISQRTPMKGNECSCS